MIRQKLMISGREVEFFCPKEISSTKNRAPVIIFGHGQAMDVTSYDMTFEHLAKKGICVLFPAFDTGFFDQDWRRMADDFAKLSALALQQMQAYADPNNIIFAGHSKGAYVALVAAGIPVEKQILKPSVLVLFSPAGYDGEWIRNIDQRIPVSVIYGESDNIIKRDLVSEIFQRLPSLYKQFILVKGYSTTQPQLPADHFFIANKKNFFGGRNGVSALHYHGVWKWLGGAAMDLQEAQQLKNIYIYGSESGTTGLSNLYHEITRSW